MEESTCHAGHTSYMHQISKKISVKSMVNKLILWLDTFSYQLMNFAKETILFPINGKIFFSFVHYDIACEAKYSFFYF